MKIEPFAQSEDINELKAVAARAFGATQDSSIEIWFSFGEMVSQIKVRRGLCVKAVSAEGRLAGFIYAQQESPINGKEGLEKWVIVITAVDPASSGSGVGSSLLREIEKRAAGRGAVKMFVYTNKGDDRVVNFYRKNGYTDAGWIKDYQYGEGNSAVFLLRHLKG